MSVIGSNVLAGASGQSAGGGAGGLISRSLRFNSGDSSFLNRTPSSAGNQKTFTWSSWVKRSKLQTLQGVFSSRSGATGLTIQLGEYGTTNDYIAIYDSNVSGYIVKTTPILRDVSAWYHLVVAVDSTQSTAANRLKIYINGVEVTDFTSDNRSNFSQNTDTRINSANAHFLGSSVANGEFFDGYLADVHFIDGQALAPTDFGETNTDNLWVPKAFAGTYNSAGADYVSQSVLTGTIYSGAGGVDKIFDGTTATCGPNAASYVTFTPSTPIPITSSFRVRANVSNASGDSVFAINGSDVSTVSTGFPAAGGIVGAASTWTTITGYTQLTSLKFGWGSNWMAVSGIEIDGVELVNIPAGVNGFHLDFADNSSNAALGTDTSGNSNTWTVNNLIANRESVSTDTISNVVTTSLSTVTLSGGFSLRNNAFYGATPPAVGSSASFGPTIGRTNGSMSFSPAITASSKIELWAYADGGVVANSVTINGSATISIPGGSGLAFTKINCNTTSLSSLAFAYPGGATDFYMVGFYVDDVWYGLNSAGSVLTFPTSNNFNSFTVGDVVQQISGATTTLSESDYNIIFGGSSAGNGYNSQSGGFTVDFTNTGFTGNTTIYANISGVGGTFNVYAKDLTTVLYTNSIPNVQYGTTDLGVNFEDIGRIQWTGDYSMSWFKANNVYVNPPLNQNSTASITTIDASGPTIKVNAGNWYGSNGSGTSGGSTVLSTTAVTNGDNLVDTPVNGDTASDTGAGGEITGNYATFNPLSIKANQGTMENGNLTLKASGSYYIEGKSTIDVFSVNNYCELTISGGSADTDGGFGIGDHDAWVAGGAGSYITYRETGAIISYPGNTTVATVASWTVGDVLGMAVDSTNVKFYKNGTLQGTYAHGKSGTFFVHVMNLASNSSAVMDINFGQRAFSNSNVPSGYKSLNSANLTATIADGSKYFDTKLWIGTGSSQAITGYNFSPDFAWIKDRGSANSHALFDTVRGISKGLHCDLTASEWTDVNTLSAFNNNGFTLGGHDVTNYSSNTYVGWAWDGGSSNTTIAAGSLNSSLYNQSQTWSSSTGITDNSGTRSSAYIFDGVITGSHSNGFNTYNSTITLANSVTATSSIRFYGAFENATGVRYTVNGTTTDAQPPEFSGNTAFGWASVTNVSFPVTINNVGLTDSSTTNGGRFVGIEIDGKLLVDSGVTPPTNVPSIASTVRASAASGFSIVSYTGTGANATFGHGLNAAPEMVIIKQRNGTGFWVVGHKGAGFTSDNYLRLNDTNANASGGGAVWQSTAPTSSVVYLGDSGISNGNNNTHIAYCFAPVEGYSSMGKYPGNGSADGPFVYTGMKPAFIMIKGTGTSNAFSWIVVDAARSEYNPTDHALFPNSSNDENNFPNYGARTFPIDFLSNGFKIRIDSTSMNSSGYEYIYLAFASNPFASNGGLAR